MMERAVLLSDPTPEFRDNTPQAFKVRLGEPMTFQDEWEVALAALSTPDTTLAWGKKDDELFQTMFTIQQPTRAKTEVISHYTLGELQQQTDITNGVQLLWALFFANEKTCYNRMQETGKDVFLGQRITLGFHKLFSSKSLAPNWGIKSSLVAGKNKPINVSCCCSNTTITITA